MPALHLVDRRAVDEAAADRDRAADDDHAAAAEMGAVGPGVVKVSEVLSEAGGDERAERDAPRRRDGEGAAQVLARPEVGERP